VGFKANQIATLSAKALPAKLRWLILTDNRLAQLPAEIGRCRRLQKLMLSGNQLQGLPAELEACANLELLRIAANQITHFPEFLFKLPKLAWLAYSGNPFSDASEVAAMADKHINFIEWHTLELQHKLGEGASGVIYRADLKSENETSQVAVKIFKGELTSDGLPRSEKAAFIAAGKHPKLIPVAGKISGHPEGTPGLVMSLVDQSYRNLAGPPSLESCSRDIYPAQSTFKLETVFNIALGIASVTEHLHAQGVLHGDLYAHNILWDEQGDCLLGDFGAASFIPQQDVRMAEALQRIEVRAFACLLQELLDRCDAVEETQHIYNELWELQQRCEQPRLNERPLFGEIHATLNVLLGEAQSINQYS